MSENGTRRRNILLITTDQMRYDSLYRSSACRRPMSSSGHGRRAYKHDDDPHQWYNLWNDPKYAAIRSDLIEDLYANLPDQRKPLLKVEAPT